MQALKLVKEHNLFIATKAGKFISEGADGECFELLNDPNKVIKFCVLYDCNTNIDSIYSKTYKLLNFIKNNNLSAYVKVHEHNFLKHGLRATCVGKQKYLLYYYIMDKLYNITNDEKKVFHSILSHEDRGVIKNYSTESSKDILCGLQRGLDFNLEKIMMFLENLKKSPIVHLDLHPRNIMKDRKGNFKLIDLDRIDWRKL